MLKVTKYDWLLLNGSNNRVRYVTYSIEPFWMRRIPDQTMRGGKPEVSNGLSLCKIHHAAYDQNILGISPDYQVEIRNDILAEVDGPILKYGLQEMNGHKLYLPHSAINKPDNNGLDTRYQQFKSA